VLVEVPVDAASEQRGRGGKISADQARAVRGMCVRLQKYLLMAWLDLQPELAEPRVMSMSGLA
jgi:hypothetical protein